MENWLPVYHVTSVLSEENMTEYSLEDRVREFVASPENDAAIVSERDIAERFGMNRSSARKLLMMFEGEGLLECMPQRGYRRIDFSATTAETHRKMRRAIEAEAARIAAERANREDIIRMILVTDEFASLDPKNEVEKLLRLDGEFHRAMVQASHDNLLEKLFSFIFFPSVRRQPLSHSDISAIAESHRRIIAGIRARDPKQAEAAAIAHLSSGKAQPEQEGENNDQ